MIARLTSSLNSIVFLIEPDDERYRVFNYEDSGYLVGTAPPEWDGRLIPMLAGSLHIKPGEAKPATAMVIYFKKLDGGDFDRRADDGWVDPPHEVLLRAVRSYETRFRYAGGCASISEGRGLENLSYIIDYLNNDGSKLARDESSHRRKICLRTHVPRSTLTPGNWNTFGSVGPGYQPKAWETLGLDAFSILPHVGSAVTLSFTALEIFISETLAALRRHAGKPETSRTARLSLEQQFTTELRNLCGKSLEDQPELKRRLDELRKVRNTFVHRGVAIDANGEPLSVAEAQELIVGAFEVISKVTSWMPEEIRWSFPWTTVRANLEVALDSANWEFGDFDVDCWPEKPND